MPNTHCKIRDVKIARGAEKDQKLRHSRTPSRSAGEVPFQLPRRATSDICGNHLARIGRLGSTGPSEVVPLSAVSKCNNLARNLVQAERWPIEFKPADRCADLPQSALP